MKTLRTVFTAVAGFAISFAALGTTEQDLIEILNSSADIPAKCDACQKLRILGTKSAVPALAPLLIQDERLSHAARYALEAMRCPEAAAAIREAACKSSGGVKVALLDSLGWRNDRSATTLLIAALGDDNHEVAAAAATALSRIGGRESVQALTNARSKASGSLQNSIEDALLGCAGALAASGDSGSAIAIYRSLQTADAPEAIRLAAWKGEAPLSPSSDKTIFEAIEGSDLQRRFVALQLLRESGGTDAVASGINRWKQLPPEAQVAVVDAALRTHAKVPEVIRLAMETGNSMVRSAGMAAVAEANAIEFLPHTARIAAGSAPVERDVARQTLARFRGPGARRAIINEIAKSAPPVQAELLKALGQRNDTEAGSVLLSYASEGEGSVRSAALESLRVLASPNTAKPLLQLAASTDDNEPALTALFAVCQAAKDKTSMASDLVTALKDISEEQATRVFPVLAELATADAMALAWTGVKSPEAERRRAALRVLSEWPTSAPSEGLIALAKSTDEPGEQILAIRGAIKTAATEPDFEKRLKLLQAAMAASPRPQEKQAAISQVGQIGTPGALDVALSFLQNADLVDEASLAVLSIAEKLSKSDRNMAAGAAAKVLTTSKNPAVMKRAWDLRGQQVAASPCIQDWLVCGPFRKAGVSGATALFPIAFSPETNEKTDWRSLPRQDHVNLGAAFPGSEHCAAYLKAQLVAAAPADAMLLMGSDDGLKVWFNGEVVHSNNVDRGDQADQDKAAIRLKPGTNELILKVTQGSGGWSARARIVGADGAPVPGLRVQPQSAPPL